MAKTVIYLRTSTGTEEKQIQTEQQEVLISDYIKKLNETTSPDEQLELVEIFREQGSANNPGRGIFNHMISSIKEWHYDELLSVDESRLSRNSIDTETLNNLLSEWYIQKIRIVSNGECYSKNHKIP